MGIFYFCLKLRTSCNGRRNRVESIRFNVFSWIISLFPSFFPFEMLSEMIPFLLCTQKKGIISLFKWSNMKFWSK